MKRVIAFFLTLIMVIGVCPWGSIIKIAAVNDDSASGQEILSPDTYKTIEIGDYIVLGSYLGEPIVWRCVDIDANGPLMLSDKILCLKAFDAAGEDDEYHTDGWGYIRANRGSNCWSDSSIRQWLNSTELMVSYTHCPPTSERVRDGHNAYSTEAGFLTNFTSSELLMIKTIEHRSYLNSWDAQREGYLDGGSEELIYEVSSTKENYDRYYYQIVTDSMFF